MRFVMILITVTRRAKYFIMRELPFWVYELPVIWSNSLQND
jgi:hypothetical protein